MLVLTRKESEKILFPTLGVTIEVLRIRGNRARIGIEAPSEIPVVRQELSGLKSVEFTAEVPPSVQLSRLLRAVRQRLDRASLSLNRLHRHLETSGDGEAQQFVLDVFRELDSLDRESGEAVESPPSPVLRALLIEDDENQRELLGGFLRLSGFDVTLSCDGQDALDYLSLHAPPDVVLLDIMMPRRDGPSFVRQIRSSAGLSDLKLFAVSGTDPASLGVTTGAGGIDGWFPKPIDIERLVQVVTKEVGQAAASSLAT
ncbi:MAG TPA: response regulator [Candidatus Anammoximicrobium sp.]|nr:response regulator [Candidatus Anammoximicrobium sp.]